MTDIEKQFFETFGIESKLKTFAIKRDEQGELTYPPIYEYPKITDSILLKLICLTGNTGYFLITNEGTPIDVEGLKNSVLHALIIYSKFHKELKHQVQTIFKESN